MKNTNILTDWKKRIQNYDNENTEHAIITTIVYKVIEELNIVDKKLNSPIVFTETIIDRVESFIQGYEILHQKKEV